MNDHCNSCSCELDQESRAFHPDFSEWCLVCFCEFLEFFSERINLENITNLECLTCDQKIETLGDKYFDDCPLCDACQEIFFAAYSQAVEKMVGFWAARCSQMKTP